jgi:autophagy-related protein 9
MDQLKEPLLEFVPELVLPDDPQANDSALSMRQIRDGDRFLSGAYDYHRRKGFKCVVATHCVNVSVVVVSAIMTWIVLMDVDWHAIATHKPNQSTNVWRPSHGSLDSRYVGFVEALMVSMSMHGAIVLVEALKDISRMRHVRARMNEVLRLTDKQLRLMTWAELVHSILDADVVGVSSIQDSRYVPARITRKDNYIAALVQKNVLSVDVPWGLRWTGMGKHMTASQEWLLKNVIVTRALHNIETYRGDSDDHDVESMVADDSVLIRKYLVVAVVVLGVLGPFLSIGLVIQFALHNAENIYKNPSGITGRQWNRLARWRFRSPNQLQHTQTQHLERARVWGNAYVNQFGSFLISVIMQFFSFFFTACIAVLIGISVVGNDAVEIELIGGRSVIWFIGLFGALLAFTKGYIVPETSVMMPDTILEKTCQHLGVPVEEFPGGTNEEKCASFIGWFPNDIEDVVREVLGRLWTPWVLALVWYARTPRILRFIYKQTFMDHHIGPICEGSVVTNDEEGGGTNALVVSPDDKDHLSQLRSDMRLLGQ